MGVASFLGNVAAGNVGGAVLDAVGIVVDSAATVVPGVPGGAGTAIKLLRGADKAADLLKAADKANDIRKAADKGAELVNSGGKLNAAARAVGAKTAKQTAGESKKAIQAGDTRRYGDYKEFPGDNIEGHELLQSSKLRQMGADATARSDNPALALTREDHQKVSKLQRKAGLHNPANLNQQTPAQNIRKNVQVTKEAGVASRSQLAEAARKAREHSKKISE